QVVVTDDYEQIPGNRERRTEEISPVKAPVQGSDTGSNPVLTRESQPIEQAPVQEVSTYTAPAATSQGYGHSSTPPHPAVSGWSNGPSLPTTPPEPGAPYRFLGKNARHIAIVVFSPNEAYLPDDQLQLLTKMLDACKLNLGDVAIINQATQVVHFTHLGDQLQSQKVLLFGVQPEQIGLPMNFPGYKEQEYAGCTYLLANPLGDMNQPNEEGKALKGKLWGCLKKMFNI
ncbi:MAG: hypothetical protein J7578_00940, partial [Chitinophagaceae bacterium]|nr:hypothetical protein [Chitinophagaceae bacterium]